MSNSLQPHGLYSPWNSPDQNTGVGSLSLLQGIFPTQGLDPDLLRCKQILYQLSHKGSPRILEWVAYPFSSRSSRPRNKTGVPCIAGRFFTNWVIREVMPLLKCLFKYCFQLFGAVFVCLFWEFFLYSEYSSLSDIWFVNIFSPSALLALFQEKKYILMTPTYPFASLWIVLLVLYPRNLCLTQVHKNFLSDFFLEGLWFYVLHLSLQSILIKFLCMVQGRRCTLKVLFFFFLHVIDSCPSITCWNDILSPFVLSDQLSINVVYCYFLSLFCSFGLSLSQYHAIYITKSLLQVLRLGNVSPPSLSFSQFFQLF